SLLCPLCLFSQFYTKIDFLENFATEPLKPWMNEQKISRILFVHPLKICEQYGFIQSCSYKSKALNRPRTIQQKK
ncbi:hypothetical protein ACPC58_11110, partial [Streptococcus sp. VTCC 12905]